MRHLLILLTVVLFGNVLVVHGQKTQSVLWEISGKGLKKHSFLFGTVHTESYKLIDSFPELKNIFHKCEFGIFEKSQNSIGDVKDVYMHTPPLDSVFTPSEYALVDSFFLKSAFGSIKPHNNEASLPGMVQAVIMIKKQDTRNQEMFFDEYIQTLFMDSLKKKTFGLDEPEEMAQKLAKTNHRELAKSIVFLITHEMNIDNAVEKHFNLPLFRTSLKSDMKLNRELGNSDVEQVLKDMTIERNRMWMPKIISKINEGSSFIAVGLGHLEYKTGLIQLFRQEGYTLKPVKLKKIRIITG